MENNKLKLGILLVWKKKELINLNLKEVRKILRNLKNKRINLIFNNNIELIKEIELKIKEIELKIKEMKENRIENNILLKNLILKVDNMEVLKNIKIYYSEIEIKKRMLKVLNREIKELKENLIKDKKEISIKIIEIRLKENKIKEIRKEIKEIEYLIFKICVEL